jgi:hypothetical protein
MKKKSTTFGLNPEKISNLLKVCAEPSGNDVDMETKQKKTELLQDRLSETLLTGSLKGSPLSKELTQLCYISGIAAGESIRNLLINPGTAIKLIEKIKEHGKSLSQSTKADVGHDIANAIYYAAIAHALIYHNLKITKFSYEELEKALSFFTQTDWVSTDLSNLFNSAVQYCREQLKNNNEGEKENE